MIKRFVIGVLRRLFVLAVMVAALALGWRHRDRLLAAWHDFRTEVAGEQAQMTVSPAVADSAERKLASLAVPDGPERISLSEAEIQSLVEYRLAALLPPSVHAPRVRLRDGRVRLEGQVPTDRIAAAPAVHEVLAFLPDTTELSAAGQVVPFGHDRVALEVVDMSAARIPLPDRMVPDLLRSLGMAREPSLPPNAVVVPLPGGAGAAYVSGDSLVVLARDRRVSAGS